MTSDVSIVRNKLELLDSLKKINRLDDALKDKKNLNKKYFELKNMIIVSRLIVQAALKRTISIGSHFIDEHDWSEVSC